MNAIKAVINKKSLALVFPLVVLAGCSSDDDDAQQRDQLLWHASSHDVIAARADGENIVFTTSSSLYVINPDNSLTVKRSVFGGPALVEVPSEQTYILASGRGPNGDISYDGGATWQVFEGDDEADAALLYASKMIDDSLYFRYSGGLISTTQTFEDFTRVSGPDDYQLWRDYGMSLVYNESRDQLWWGETELSSAHGLRLNIRRLDRSSGEIVTLWTDNDPVFLDGSADFYDSNVVMLGGQGGLFITQDNGSNWQSYPDDGTDVTIFSVTQDQSTGNFYAFARIHDQQIDQIWCSPDQGQSWVRTEFGDNNARSASDSMLIMLRGGEQKLIVPTVRGVFEAPLSLFGC